MSDVQISYSPISPETVIRMSIPQFSIEAYAEAINLAKQEIAKKFWEENADKIFAQMNLVGLANLIAVHASKALKEQNNKEPSK